MRAGAQRLLVTTFVAAACIVGCQCGGVDLSQERFACQTDHECIDEHVCIEGVCSPPGGQDGGEDAGQVDAGVDAGTDAGDADAGVDAGDIDAGFDAGGLDAGGDAGLDAGLDAGTDAGADAGLDVDLIAHWPFDETSGSIAHDATGHGHDAELDGGAFTPGHAGNAFFLTGGTVGFAPASPAFDRPVGAAFTITAWIRRTATLSHNLVLMNTFAASSGGFGLELESNTVLTYWDGTTHVAESTIVFPSNEWHHVAVVVVNGIATLYFDATPLNTAGADDTARTSMGVLLAGGNYGDRWPGAIDEVRYYGRALSVAEVAADMAR